MALTLPTADEIYQLAQAEIQARQPALTDFTAGSDLDALTGSAVILADQVIRIVVDRMAAGFVATAVGDDLDTVVTDRYPSLTRTEASASVGTVTFTRGTTTGAISIPAGTTIRATVSGTSVDFTTDLTVVMGSGDSSIAARATCTATGAAGNVAASTVTTIVSDIPDDTAGDLTLSNAERFVGGADEEGDDAYRARAQAYPSTLGLGTAAALRTAAIAVPGIAYATVRDDATPGIAHVYVADADGNSNSAQVADAQTAVDAVRAAGVLVTVEGASRETVAVDLTVYVTTGTGTSALSNAVVAAVLAYTDSLGPDEALYLSRVVAAACGVSDDVLGAVAESADSADGVLVEASAAENVLRVEAADLTVTLVDA